LIFKLIFQKKDEVCPIDTYSASTLIAFRIDIALETNAI